MQTKKQSLTEAITNTAIGFIISYVSTFLIFPLVGVKTSPGTNLLIVVYFTIVSVIRSYVIRRCFNKQTKIPVTYPNGEDFLLYCYQCEIEMPVYKQKNKVYCNNCGLRH